MVKDMTEGKPMKLIWQFSLPILFGSIFQQLYSIIDSIIVGKVLGVSELTAIGVTGSLNFLIMGFVEGICSGFAIPVAQQFGAKDYKNMRSYIKNATYLSVVLAVIITVLTAIFCMNILELMQTPPEFIKNSYSYMVIIFWGIPVTFLYNVVSGFLRALGDSKTPFYFLIVATIINIVLDLVFIIPFQMGVGGAALATVISQGVAGGLCLVYMMKRYDIFKFSKDEKKIKFDKIYILLKMGIPMGLQYSITAIGTIMLQSAVNGLDTVYVEAVATAAKVKHLGMCPYNAFANASANFCSQNLGAKKIDRIHQGLRSSLIIGFVYSVVIAIVLVTCGSNIASVFVDMKEPGITEVLNNVQILLSYTGFFYLFLSVLNITRMTIQGLGYSGASIISGVSELVVRAAMAIWFIPKFGYIAVCFADPISWVLAAVCVVIIYVIIIKNFNKKYRLNKGTI